MSFKVGRGHWIFSFIRDVTIIVDGQQGWQRCRVGDAVFLWVYEVIEAGVAQFFGHGNGVSAQLVTGCGFEGLPSGTSMHLSFMFLTALGYLL